MQTSRLGLTKLSKLPKRIEGWPPSTQQNFRVHNRVLGAWEEVELGLAFKAFEWARAFIASRDWAKEGDSSLLTCVTRLIWLTCAQGNAIAILTAELGS
jgi:hypothetical protein